MTLLAPLGLLGLLGLIGLLLIYIIKPNYQQKMISSTFVWKLSLKYRKKRIPLNKWRNILLILCQIFILVFCAVILAKPAKVLKTNIEEPEIVLIIDSSASMRTVSANGSRFSRAVDLAKARASATFAEDGIVHVIMANDAPTFLERNVRANGASALNSTLSALVTDDACAYGVADMEGAVTLCEDIVQNNPDAEIYLYTDTEYEYTPEELNVVSVVDKDENDNPTEWNAAILNVSTEVNENYYNFVVDVACYGRSKDINVVVEIQQPSAGDAATPVLPKTLEATVPCEMGKTKRVVFVNADKYSADAEQADVYYVPIDKSNWISVYESVLVYLNEADSFNGDNTFSLYDGVKQELKIYYGSSLSNPFFVGILDTLGEFYADKWDITLDERKDVREAIKTEGYDLYIYEHEMPEKMPIDGVVFLVDPQNEPLQSGVRNPVVGNFNGEEVTVLKEKDHPLLDYMNLNNIFITQYMSAEYAPDYEVLATCGDVPVLLIKEEMDAKVVVMPFSLHYSNFAVLKEFPLFMLNFFEYFFPSTTTGAAFEVNENIVLNARGSSLKISAGNKTLQTFTTFPTEYKVDKPGMYFLTQTVFDKEIKETIYVRIPVVESDIFASGDALPNPYSNVDTSGYYQDLLLIAAAVLVALLFAEWWLQSRENM